MGSSDTPDLPTAAALHALGRLHGWEIPRVASAAMERGAYSQSLVRLIGMPHPRLEVAGPIFEQALRECGIALPTPETARTVLGASSG